MNTSDQKPPCHENKFCAMKYTFKDGYVIFLPEYYVYIPILSRSLACFSTRFLRARWSGPWDKEKASVTCALASRLPRPPDEQLLMHLEFGSVALHTTTWQWTKTNGWSAMNLKASRLKRWTLTEGAERYFMVKSFGHLRKKIKVNKRRIKIEVICQTKGRLFNQVFKHPEVGWKTRHSRVFV